MQVTVDLGFPSIVLAVFLVVGPAIGFFIRRKWRRGVARKEEIRRLLVLASEEATRAEFESNLAFYSSSSSSSQGLSSSVSGNGYLCAVCFYPTTTRCARCKAVRYCSGKCQIIHWRQGHKEECRPFTEINGMDENARTSSQKVAVKRQDDVCNERFEDNLADTPRVEYNSNRSFEARLVKNVGSKDELANGKRISDASDSSDNSFSGFSSSPPYGSSDGASVGYNTSSTETEGSDGSPSNDAFPDKHGFDKVDHSQSSSPKFASLVDSVDTFDQPSELNCSKAESDNSRLNKRASTDSSNQSIRGTNENSTNKYADNSSGFWGRTLESVVAHLDAREGSSESGCGGDHINDRSHVESFLLSNATSSSNISVMHAKGLEMKGIMSENKTVTPTAGGRAVNKTLLSESPGVGNMEIRSFPSVSCRSANHVDNDSRGVSDKPKCIEQGSVLSSSGDACQSSLNNKSLPVQTPEVCTSSSVNSGGFKSVVSNTGGTSHTSKAKISSVASQSHVAPSASGQSLLDMKHEKQDNIEVGLRTSTSVNPTRYVGGLKSSVLKVVDQFRGPRYGRYSEKGLFSYDLFVKLYTSNKVELTPFGIINCGNSCYANAVLQCLAFTPPLTAYFVQGLHSESCGKKGWCFTCELERLIMKAKDGKSPVSPIGILSQLRHIGSELSNGREEDAHEFLRYSIDTMQSVCLGDSSSGHLEEETTIIGLTFGGYLHSKIRCLKCQYKSEREERMMDIAVEIEGEVVKLEDALRRFTSTEILDGDNKYQCSRCKSKEKAKKKLTILEAPNVLTIALKRFQSGKFGKLNKSIEFPEILNLAPYMSGTSDKSPIYRLYGVIVHLDVMNAAFSGHYVCYVKNFQNKWFKVDDSMVTSVGLENVLTKGAYMLLYSRCSPRAPRLIRNSIMSPDSKNRSNPSRTNTKSNVLNSRSMSTRLNVTHSNPYKSPENLTNVESFYLKFHRLQRILEEDSSSDSFSFTSSNSDEGSYSTDSTQESACTDDISDYIFGGWNSSWRSTSDSDTSSSSSSPMYSTYSPTSHLDVRRSSSLRETWSNTNHMGSTMVDGQPNSLRGSGGTVNLEGDKGVPFWQPETNKPSRSLVGSSSCRETNSVKLGSVNHLGDVKFRTSLRRSTSERTD